ncbi:MAG TPA: lipoyl domain-containing protein [Pirellulales bacterium]|jgi:pyruvate/2-oxoglutarate dehydrogenase complex dihydrolipoamide acyltransferase (E2) component|nr:lipoyl domain-containing protein [Pirellulales bacterium]
MHYSLVAPELELPDAMVTVSLWLVELGAHVQAGERIVELLAGDITVDLSSPAAGILREIRVSEDEAAPAGQVLGTIEFA